jgi:phage shock protein PspC (stress-responsive transcriptional regulator)
MIDRPPLRRSRRHRILGGVCGGLAEWSGRSVGLIRFLYVLVSIVSVAFPGIAVYLILWIFIPEAPQDPSNPIKSHTGRNIFLAILVVLFILLLPLLGFVALRTEKSP